MQRDLFLDQSSPAMQTKMADLRLGGEEGGGMYLAFEVNYRQWRKRYQRDNRSQGEGWGREKIKAGTMK